MAMGVKQIGTIDRSWRFSISRIQLVIFCTESIVAKTIVTLIFIVFFNLFFTLGISMIFFIAYFFVSGHEKQIDIRDVCKTVRLSSLVGA